MKVIILNYWQTSVDVATIDYSYLLNREDGEETEERIERYLSEELGYSLDAINYMISYNDDEPIPIYQTERDLLTDAPLYVIR